MTGVADKPKLETVLRTAIRRRGYSYRTEESRVKTLAHAAALAWRSHGASIASRLVIEGLTPKFTHTDRMREAGAAGFGRWSGPVLAMAV